MFVAPYHTLDGSCFEQLTIAHNRDADGFKDTWYDEYDAHNMQRFYNYMPSSN